MSIKQAPATQSGTSFNVTVLRGELHRLPQWRILPSGDSVTTCEIKVRSEARNEVLRVSWLNAPASAMEFNEGDDLVVAGRVRTYWSGKRSETDVLATSIVTAKSIKSVRKAMAASMAYLQAACP